MVHHNGPPTAFLGLLGEAKTGPGQRQDWREHRHVLKVAQRAMTEGKALKLCYLASERRVTVSVGPQLVAHVSGIHRCGSVWACPVCAPVVRHGRAVEIDQGASRLFKAGGSALLVSATGAHRKGDPLAPLFNLTCKFGELTMTGAKAKGLRDRLGLVGSVRALDITYGDNGPHPHVHSMMCFDRVLSPGEVAELRTFLFGRWELALVKRGFPRLHPVAGLDVRPVYDSEGMSEYLTKVEDGWSVGSEVARPDRKQHGRTPFGLLSDWALGGDLDARALWLEYEQVTFGRKAIQWSSGLRRYLLGDLVEQTDEELAASEGEDEVLVTWRFDHQEWNTWVRAGDMGLVLRQVEQVSALLMVLSGRLVLGTRTDAREGKVNV